MNNKINQNVPFFNTQIVNGQYDFAKVAEKVLNSWWYILGDEVSSFEAEYAQYLNLPHCISVANGTEALEIALKSVGVASGDKVVAVANAGFYSSTAIYAVGAKPLYVDICPESLTMSSTSFADALSHQPKAVIVTHLYGQLAPEIEEIVKLAKDAGIVVIEDCAQSHGAKLHGRQAGTFGDIACYSFYPTKNLGALGDGGAIATNNDTYAANTRQLRQYGWSQKYHVDVRGGTNSRLDELQAAFLRSKLPDLDKANQQRRDIARKYSAAFSELDIKTPNYNDESYVAHLYVIQSNRRDQLAAFLKGRGIGCDIHYPIADHLQKAYQYETTGISLSATEFACMNVISLPCYPGLKDSDVDAVIEAVSDFYSEAH